MRKNVIILYNYDWSDNTAAFTRVVEYAKGLTFNRDDVSVFLLSTNYFEPGLIKQCEEEQKIYISARPDITKKYNYIFSRYGGFVSRKKNVDRILLYFKDKNETVFLLYPFFNTFYEEYFFIRLIKRNGHKVFSERNELASGVVLNKSFPSSFWKKIMLLSLYPLDAVNAFFQDQMVRFYDGNIVISSGFEEWIKRKNKRYIHIPVLANQQLRSCLSDHKDEIFTIAYTGRLTFKKDGIDILLKAMRLLVHIHDKTNIRLDLYGQATVDEKKKIRELINNFQLEKYVFINEQTSREKINKVQANRDCLIVLRKNNLQNRFNFSTKLAEYMSAGNIVIATDISDNAKYIQNGVNGFITELSPESVAVTITRCMALPGEERDKIRSEAMFTAKKYFNIEVYASDLQQFILS